MQVILLFLMGFPPVFLQSVQLNNKYFGHRKSYPFMTFQYWKPQLIMPGPSVSEGAPLRPAIAARQQEIDHNQSLEATIRRGLVWRGIVRSLYPIGTQPQNGAIRGPAASRRQGKSKLLQAALVRRTSLVWLPNHPLVAETAISRNLLPLTAHLICQLFDPIGSKYMCLELPAFMFMAE
jgi:hypothetical protein